MHSLLRKNITNVPKIKGVKMTKSIKISRLKLVGCLSDLIKLYSSNNMLSLL